MARVGDASEGERRDAAIEAEKEERESGGAERCGEGGDDWSQRRSSLRARALRRRQAKDIFLLTR